MDQLVHPTLLQSIAFRLWQIYLPKIVRQCGQLSSSPPGNAVHLWWAMMIGWVIWVMKVNQNAKKSPPKSSKNEKLIFILHSTSDDQPSVPSNKNQLKCKKRPPKSSKNEMLGFGLHSTSDDQPSDLSDAHQPKCKKIKKGPLCHQKIKCSFLDYVQLLMIGQVISAMKVDQKAKKWKKAPNVIEK